jgi:hypothetical protein
MDGVVPAANGKSDAKLSREGIKRTLHALIIHGEGITGKKKEKKQEWRNSAQEK